MDCWELCLDSASFQRTRDIVALSESCFLLEIADLGTALVGFSSLLSLNSLDQMLAKTR